MKLKEECTAILERKTAIITEFKKDLQYKDLLYVNTINSFRQEIELMISLMSKQFFDTRSKTFDAFNSIEGKFLEDRKLLLEEYKTKVTGMIKRLIFLQTEQENELKNLEDRLENECDLSVYNLEMTFINKVLLMEKMHNKLDELIEEYNYDIKIMKERLDYRLEVRREKIKESNEKIKRYTELAKKLKEERNKLRIEYLQNHRKYKAINSKLQEKFIKLTKKYEDLKQKFQHFEKYDDQQFKAIYEMNSNMAKELAKKVYYANRTIATQLLGKDDIAQENPNSFTLEELSKETNFKEEAKEDEKKIKSLEEQSKNQPSLISRIPLERIKAVFGYIVAEAEFMVETEVIQECAGMSFEDKLPRYVESLVRGLGIKTENELQQLISFFEKHNQAQEEENLAEFSEESEEDDREARNRQKPLELDPDGIIGLLKEYWVEKKQRQQDQSLFIKSNG